MERRLEDAAAAGDDVAVAGDDVVVAGDDVTETGDDAYLASNETLSVYYNNTVVDRVKGTYQAVPAEWSKEQWGFFAALMFIFGMISSLFFFFFVFPSCCPKTARNAYARFIISNQDEKDWKRVELIKI